MKGLRSMIRLQKWQVDEKRRQLTDLESMRADLVRRKQDLRNEIAHEQKAADQQVIQFAFASYVRDALARLETLASSIAEVDIAIDAMQDEVAAAFRELKKYEVAEARNEARADAEAQRRDQMATDEIALNMFRQQG